MQKGDFDAYFAARQEAVKEYGNPRRDSFETGKIVIPKSFWRLDGINWEASEAKGPNGWYDEIYCFADSVFSCFPLPPVGEATVKTVGGFLAVENNSFEVEGEARTTKRGRPAMIDWHAFYVELVRLFLSKEMPTKQEALISLMQEWCVSKWGIAPKRTAVLERVSPFKKLMSENQT